MIVVCQTRKMKPRPLTTQYALHYGTLLMSYQRYVIGSHSNSTQSHMISPPQVYGASVCGGDQTYPLQQKLVACTLLCMVRGRGKKETTLGKLHDSYVKVRRSLGVCGVGVLLCIVLVCRCAVTVGYGVRASVSLWGCVRCWRLVGSLAPRKPKRGEIARWAGCVCLVVGVA